MTTADDISEMLEAYYQTEHQLIELNRIISVDNKPETFSPRLYSMLGDSCNQVENMIRLICDQLGLSYPTNNAYFSDFYEKLNQTGILRMQAIDLLIGTKVYFPFSIENGKKTPSWWRSYNDTKHNLPEGYKQGNLHNTLCALSAAYSLHCISAYADEYGTDILNKNWWHAKESTGVKTRQEFPEVADKIHPDFVPKSKIFFSLIFYTHLGPESGAPNL